MSGRSFNTPGYKYGMNGQEKDDEISGNGNHTTALYWEYDTRLGRRWNLDPKPTAFNSSYSCFLNNPILYPDYLGDVVDPSGLTKEQLGQYNAQIEVLSQSKIFKIYYDHLQSSKTVYTIKVGDESMKNGGSFNPNTNDVTLKSFGAPETVLGQELFHAFQFDLKVYDPIKDHTVIETEGDIVTQYIANEAGLPMAGFLAEQADTWAGGILGTDGKQFDNPTADEVLSTDYDAKFSESVDKRISHFKTQGEGYKGYYSTPNSGTKPLATKKIFETLKNESNKTTPVKEEK